MRINKLKMAIANSLGIALVAQLGFADVALANGQKPVIKGTSVAELQRIIEEQQRQLDEQQRMLQMLKDQVNELSSQAVVPAAPEAPKRVVTSGVDGIKLSVTGQVNRGVMYSDDGDQGEWYHVDNDNSSTRVRFIGSGQVTEDFSVGTQIEVQFESNSTASVNQNNRRGVGPNNFTERKLELYADSKRMGRLWVGQGDTASNGSSEVDLSEVDVIGYSAIEDMAGGILFRDDDSGELTNISIGSVFDNFDGLGRDDRLRYDTPNLAGFKASSSWVANDRWDVALRYGGDFGPIKAAVAVAYSDPKDARDNIVNGSATVLHRSGLNFTVAAGGEERDDRDPFGWYVKLGYLANLSQLGKTAFAVDYTENDEVAADGDDAKAYGAFVVQQLKDFGTEFYLGVRNHEFDRPGTSIDDIFILLTGARVKF